MFAGKVSANVAVLSAAMLVASLVSCDGGSASPAAADAGSPSVAKFVSIAWNSNGGNMIALTENGDTYFGELRIRDDGQVFRRWTKEFSIPAEVATWEKILAEQQQQPPQQQPEQQPATQP